MFATLLGGLPRPDGAERLDDAVVAAIRAQDAAGLEPVTDGRLRDPGFEALIQGITGHEDPQDPVAAWRFAAGRTQRAVKQALPGPYSIGWRAGRDRDATIRRVADGLNVLVRELAAAGCPLVEIEEAEAHRVGDDEAQRGLFREAHERLTDGIQGTHLSLSIVGGGADRAGVETILGAPYASLAVDLIAGPDNWNLVTRTPRDRGIVVGALSARPAAEPKELLLWGARYAASTAGRGIERVGIGSAGSWASLNWEEAVRRMQALGDAARLAAMPPSEELRRSLDARSVSIRRAALGHDAPPPPPSKRRRR